MRKKPPTTMQVGVRISKDTKAALDREAEADSRSTASLIRKILSEYVARKVSK